jgi:hypothetical protein
VGSARETPHPSRSPPRSSSRPPAPGARAAANFLSTSPWATSPSQSSPSCPPLAQGHDDTVSIERQHDSSSSLHAIVAREAARETSTSAKQAAALRRRRGSVDLDLGKQVAVLGGMLDLGSRLRAWPRLLPPRRH